MKLLVLPKGKTANMVGDVKQLVPRVWSLRPALATGELDAQIQATSSEVERRILK